jgi:DNA-binding winged helix-turn-helix (wHTH) protein/GTPase SAR1 family protein
MKEFKPFRLDPANHRLWRDAGESEPVSVTITAKAFDVLRYMVEHPGRLITHDELLESLWSGVAVQPEVLKGHVLAIRNALGDDAQRPRYIETHRGRGYRFIADVTTAQKTDNLLSSATTSHLIGRAAPLDALHEALHHLREGRPKIVFVHGDAGIGKTALVETFCSNLSSQHTALSYGRCIEGFSGAEPFYPVIEALSRLLKGANSNKVQDILVTVAPSWANQVTGLLSREHRALLQKVAHVSARSRMLGEFCELIEVLAENEAFVLLLEDLHWADFSTLDLISALARRRSSVKLLLIATYRSDDLATRGPALRQLVNELLLHKLCESIHLHGLRQGDIAEYVRADDSEDGRSFVQLLLRQSSGNPLFLSTILDHLKSIQLVSIDRGQWKSDVPLSQIRFEIPQTIAHVVETKISSLDDETQRVLEAASAVGDVFNSVVPATAIRGGVRSAMPNPNIHSSPRHGYAGWWRSGSAIPFQSRAAQGSATKPPGTTATGAKSRVDRQRAGKIVSKRVKSARGVRTCRAIFQCTRMVQGTHLLKDRTADGEAPLCASRCFSHSRQGR